MHDSSLPDAVRDACERLGYHVTTPENFGADAVAWPGVDAVPIPGGRHDARPTAVELVEAVDPEAVLSRVERAREWGRSCLLVPVGDGTAGDLSSLLAPPGGVRDEDELGHRTFYTGSDRVHLDGGGLALYSTDRHGGDPTFEWFEEPAGDGSEGTDEDRRSGPPDTASERGPLVVAADGDPIAALDGVDALSCPGPDPSAFAYHYSREDDRLFHVYDADDREIGVFTGVTAMRDRGFHPVPAPVVPERIVRASPGSLCGVFDPDGGRLTTTSGTPISR